VVDNLHLNDGTNESIDSGISLSSHGTFLDNPSFADVIDLGPPKNIVERRRSCRGDLALDQIRAEPAAPKRTSSLGWKPLGNKKNNAEKPSLPKRSISMGATVPRNNKLQGSRLAKLSSHERSDTTEETASISSSSYNDYQPTKEEIYENALRRAEERQMLKHIKEVHQKQQQEQLPQDPIPPPVQVEIVPPPPPEEEEPVTVTPGSMKSERSKKKSKAKKVLKKLKSKNIFKKNKKDAAEENDTMSVTSSSTRKTTRSTTSNSISRSQPVTLSSFLDKDDDSGDDSDDDDDDDDDSDDKTTRSGVDSIFQLGMNGLSVLERMYEDLTAQ
jgi:hypothetical protein